VVGTLATLFVCGLGWYQVALYSEIIITRTSRETDWTYDCLRISIMILVGLSCLLFLYKLLIRRRKRLGFTKFGPLQVLFILFAQCLVIPCMYLSRPLVKLVAVYILDFTFPQVKNLSGLAQCLLICSLPLFSIWASAEAQGEQRQEHGNIITTTDSDLTPSSSTRASSPFVEKYRALLRESRDSQQMNPDMEMGPYSEKPVPTSQTEFKTTPNSV